MKIQFSLKNVRVGVPGIMSVQYLVTYVPDVMTITSLAGEIRVVRVQRRMKLLLDLLLVLAVLPTFEATRISPRQIPTIVYQQFVIDSVIVARYSNTRISSVVRNNADISQELSFRVQLPETAFISNFTM